jgi:DNA polymerase III epsilon subunit-like protein
MSLLEVQLEARNILQVRPLFLHSKTTGAAELSEVVEIAILDSDGAPLADELVRPKRHIRPEATLVHGLSDENVNYAARWSEILPKVEEILAGKMICVYDLDYELQAMKNSCQNYHNRWALDDDKFVSLMDLFSRFKNERDSRSGALRTFTLEEATCSLGIEIEVIAYRRAREDAWLMRALLMAIAGWKVYY